MRQWVAWVVFLLSATAHSSSLDLRGGDVKGQEVGTINNNFRRIDSTKQDKTSQSRPGDLWIRSINGVAYSSSSASAVVNSTWVHKTDAFSCSGSTYTQITGLQASITPSSSANNVKVTVSLGRTGVTATVNLAAFQVLRDSIPICIGDLEGSRDRVSFTIDYNSDAGSVYGAGQTFVCFDSPATTSSAKYNVAVQATGGNTFYLNYRGADVDAAGPGSARTISSIYLQELAP